MRAAPDRDQKGRPGQLLPNPACMQGHKGPLPRTRQKGRTSEPTSRVKLIPALQMRRQPTSEKETGARSRAAEQGEVTRTRPQHRNDRQWWPEAELREREKENAGLSSAFPANSVISLLQYPQSAH